MYLLAFKAQDEDKRYGEFSFIFVLYLPDYIVLTTLKLVLKRIHSPAVCPRMNKDRVIMDLRATDVPWPK
jgi:hypothetical protein